MRSHRFHHANLTHCIADRYRSDFHQAPALLGKLKRMGGCGARKRSSAYVDPRDIEGCEALLEAHFTQVCPPCPHPHGHNLSLD